MSSKTRKQWEEYLNGKCKSRSAVSIANMEPHTCNAPVAKEKSARLNGRCNITVTSYIKRERDPDGTSFKYCLDSIVDAKILGGDTSEFIEEIRHRQVKIKGPEWTEIVIEEVEAVTK